jgi:hypothetical protein
VSYKKSWTDEFISCPTREMKRTMIPLSWSALYHPNRKLAGEWRWGKLRRRREWKPRGAEIPRCPWESRFCTLSVFRSCGWRMRRTTGQRGGSVAERFVPLSVGEEWARSVCYHPCHRLYVGTDWGASTIPVHSPPSDAHLTLTVDFVLRSSRMATNIS